MSNEVAYIDGLTGTWTAGPTPTVNAPIVPYRQGLDGGMAFERPLANHSPVGGPTPILDWALEAETYTTPTGARAWRPTAAEDALVDAVTRNPYAGLDELAEAGARRGGSQGIKNLPYVGDVIGGVAEGAAVYGDTGSLTHGAFAGVGSGVGGAVGTAAGAAIGAAGGPVGVAVGGALGGAVGGAVGSAVGQALADLINPLPPANVTGLEVPGSYPYATENAAGQLMQIYWDYKYEGSDWKPNQWVGVNDVYPYKNVATGVQGCPNGSTHRSIAMGTRSLASGCGAAVRNVRMSPWPSNTTKPIQPVIPPEIYRPTIPIPTLPKPPGFRLPQPIIGTPRLPEPNPITIPAPGPTGQPAPGPTGQPAPGPRPGPTPIPMPRVPSVPDFGQPSTGPTSRPHSDPYPTPDPTNPNPDIQPKPEEDPCDPCVELKDIKTLLDGTFSLDWNLPECETDFIFDRSGSSQGQGLEGISRQITELYKTVKVLHDNTRCNDGNLSGVPDDFGRSPETNRPTIILFYKEKKGKKWQRSTYTTTIFYPKENVVADIFDRKTLTPPSRNIGNGFATLTLPDSSRLKAFGLTESGAIATLSWMVRYCSVAPSNWQDKLISGTRNGLSNKLVYCRRAEYYPDGFKAEAVPEKKRVFGNGL